MKLQIDFSQGGNDTLDRVIEAYGFRTKVALAEHLGIASSSLANRYKRDFFPADIVVRCMAETGATLEWLVTGNGPKFDGEDLDILRIARQKIVLCWIKLHFCQEKQYQRSLFVSLKAQRRMLSRGSFQRCLMVNGLSILKVKQA